MRPPTGRVRFFPRSHLFSLSPLARWIAEIALLPCKSLNDEDGLHLQAVFTFGRSQP